MAVVMWFRQDLRLHDNPALSAAIANGETVIPLYILDDENAGKWQMGGASRWWLHHSLQALDASLQAKGFGALVLLKGDAEKELASFVKKNDITDVYWNRRYEPWAIARDTRIKKSLAVETHSFAAYLLFEPWVIKNKTGGQYKVFTPFSRAVMAQAQDILPPDTKTHKASGKPHTVKGIKLTDLGLMPDIAWYTGMAAEWQPGEEGASERLDETVHKIAGHYKERRDFPAVDGVSRLSPHLHFGEMSPRQVWHAVSTESRRHGHSKYSQNAEGFLRQLIWRDFSWHLLYHDPKFPDREWNPQFRKFPWKKNAKFLRAWQRGQTGYPIVDAGMRQLWQTGWMHNRVRMIVGSFLVKNLLIDWRAGEEWFWDTLVDADLGNNAAGWQWIAGCGADAAPYFRIFNPILQSKKFDTDGDYIRAYVPELADVPATYIHAPWEAPPMIRTALHGKYPPPIVDHATARDAALAAYRESRPDRAGDEEGGEE